MSGSSSTTAKMKQMLKQQNDQRLPANKVSREMYSLNLKQIGNKSQVKTSHRPGASASQSKNDTSMNEHTPQNYIQQVDLSIPVSGRNNGQNLQSKVSNNH